jgi:glycosyltransferase involved in cell wall biosynthesis
MIKLIYLGGEDISARLDMAVRIKSLGFNIEIIGTQNTSAFKGKMIPYKKYSLNRELNFINDLKSIFEIRTILKGQRGFAIVHAFDTKPAMYLPFAVWGLKNIKIVKTITGMGRIFTEQSFKNTILKTVYKLIQKAVKSKIDKIIFQNNDDCNYYVKNNLINIKNAVVIKSSGIDLARFTAKVKDSQLSLLRKALNLHNKKTFILVSRLVKQKGILNYLQAAKICKTKGYQYNFLLVGQLDTDNSITLGEVESYNEYVNYLGKREDIQELLLLSDIFVLPTYYREGVPRVLLEASAIGLPLITTNMPGCKDVLINGFNGIVTNVKDSTDLSKKMIALAEDEELLNKLSINAKEKVKEFDLKIVVEQYNHVYRSVLMK